MKSALLLLILALAFTSGTAQAPDYHYAFDGNTLDSSVNRANGNLFGTSGYGVNRTGVAGRSIYFETDGQMFSFPKNLDGNQLSICFWYKTNIDGVTLPSAEESFPIAITPDTVNGGMRWFVNIFRSSAMNDRLWFNVITGDGYKPLCIAVDTSWNHFAFVWNITGTTGEVKGYKNGTLVETISGLTVNNFMEAHYLNLPGDDSKSLLDDLKIYRRILTDSEIAVLGEGGGSTSVFEETQPIEIVKIYPGPAVDHVSFDIQGAVQPTNIRIVDRLGSVVLHATQALAIPVSTLPNGTYHLQAFAQGATIATGTFIVLR